MAERFMEINAVGLKIGRDFSKLTPLQQRWAGAVVREVFITASKLLPADGTAPDPSTPEFSRRALVIDLHTGKPAR